MTHTIDSASHVQRLGCIARSLPRPLHRTIDRLQRALEAHRRRRQGRRELARLSPCELRDIGLCEHDWQRELGKSPWLW